MVYKLLHRLPHVVHYWLTKFVFPPTLRHQGMKLSASGQDIGGDMLFSKRVGFSGTPSDLIPIELGKIQVGVASTQNLSCCVFSCFAPVRSAFFWFVCHSAFAVFWV